MNLTQYKNEYLKYFEQLKNSDLISIKTNKTNTTQIVFKKNNRKKVLTIDARIQMQETGLLKFWFELNTKAKAIEGFEDLLEEPITSIESLALYQAKDMFCDEQALEFQYNQDHYFYILIYTNMAEMTLEIFKEKLDAKKFEQISF